MFVIYEVFRKDGKKVWRFEHEHLIDCEVWIRNHEYDEPTAVRGQSYFQVEKV